MMSYLATQTNSPIAERQTGRIQVIFGPMFSGKTTELLRRIKRYQIANYRCIVIKYANDCRYDKDGVATHDKQILPALSAVRLFDLRDTLTQYQFPDIVSFCDLMAEEGKIVVVAALDGTFQRKGFGDILNLVPISESVIKLTAVCMGCFREASYTKRKGYETQVEVIGGADKYEASCRRCFKSLTEFSPDDEGKENSQPITKDTLRSTENVPSTKHTPRANRSRSVLHPQELFAPLPNLER